MSETAEIMVQFKRGVSEDAARKVVSNAGGTVRRRMRTDHEDEVMLLVKVGADGMDALEKTVKAHNDVTLTERNQGGFSIR